MYALFETLGATVDDYPDNFTHLVEAGTIDAAESGFAIADSLPAPATVASNLAMYPKVNVLVVNADVSRDLDPADLAVLEEAAVETRDRVVRDAVPEAEEAAAYCDRGGTVVAAPPEAGTALTAAARPVYVRLERDETTRSLIESVRTAKDALPPGPPVATCSSSARPHDEAGTAASAPITDGIYRYQVDFEYLVDAGLDPDQAAEESGVHTVTLDGGAYEDAWVNEDTTGRCTGRYRFDGPRITVSWSGSCVGDFAMTATVDGDQVHWRDIEALPPHSTPEDQVVNEAFNSVPWTRVGDVPN